MNLEGGIKEAATGGVPLKKVFFNVLQNSQANTCDLNTPTLSKQRFQHWCFPMNFVKFLRTPFLQKTSGRLLLVSFTLSRNSFLKENKRLNSDVFV